MFKKIDEAAKSGNVKQDIFFEILQLHNILLREADVKALKEQFSEKNASRIKYREALAVIAVDIASEDPFKSYWVIRNT